ncbi:hypothetical protein PIB30_024731 [Stylosanthes scabra]|uniref:Spermidine hydroxycinnamoyl transferase n=1 Tax=Stylosanthes scabra TaxID=79078 RepID=A0ABU6S9N6_9FABA|nr:hypothetical protein [Stylosanthes scabra]
MVSIKASYVVTPKEETPKGLFCLSESDQIWRWSHTATIYVYNNNNNDVNMNVDELVQRMRDSLSHLLVHYYPLCGRLSWTEGGRLQMDCNTKGVILIQAESTKSIDEYGEFSPNDDAIKELIPNLDYSKPIEDIPLFLAQVTKFHGDGNAIAIATAISHTMSDGVSRTQFNNSWAKLARGGALGPDELPFIDRMVFTSSSLPALRRFDHPEFKPPPLILGRTDNIEEQKKSRREARFKLTAEQVQKLKQKAHIGGDSESMQRPVSRFEAIGAHIWRCACMARGLDKSQPTLAKTMVNVRNKVNPPLPKNYFGNAIASTVTSTCCVGDIISEPLGYTAKKIREAVERVSNDEYIRSQLEHIAEVQDGMDSIRTQFLEKGEYKANASFYGNPNIVLGSWTHFPVYETDFGWGKPNYFGPTYVSPFDMGIVAPSPDGDDGSVLVLLCFQIEHMDKFIKHFWDI